MPLLKAQLSTRTRLAVSTAAWYRKQQPTIKDALAAMRREIWAAQGFSTSRTMTGNRKRPQRLREAINYALCHAA